jgi:hypothetical protein
VKNIALTAVAFSAFLSGAPLAYAASLNLEYMQDYEAAYLATCTQAHTAQECQRAMELLEQKLGLDEFVLLVSNAKILEIVSAAK